MLLTGTVFTFSTNAQTCTNHNETVPNAFNESFGRNFSTTVAQATGSWGAFSNASATVVMTQPYYSVTPPTPNRAIKFTNWRTDGVQPDANTPGATGTGICRATSPLVNLSTGICCPGELKLNFTLWTYTVVNGDVNASLHVEFSRDGGTTWTQVWSKTSDQIFDTWGANGKVGISVAIDQIYQVSNFRYRLSGINNNGNSNNFYVFVDDLVINSPTTCAATVSVGDRVFYDRNDNGFREDAEVGLGGWTVRLYRDADNNNVPDGAAIASTVTDASGNYRFSNLAPGNYIVGVTPTSDHFSSTVNGGDPDNDFDRDDNGVTLSGTEVRGQSITLTLGGEPLETGNYNNTYDFGFWKDNGLGDFVWLDDNYNGIQDAGEPGIANVTVQLLGAGDVVKATTTTDANGFYFFEYPGFQAGTSPYKLRFITPAGYSPTITNAGGDDAKDSDPINGVISGINVPVGQWDHSFDCGFVRVGSIGDRVWNDLDKDGIQDAGETGVAGITVTLFNNAGNVIATTVTDALGNYTFSNLPVSIAGTNYQVRFSLPAEYRFSPADQGGNDNTDSDPNPVTGRTGNVTLTVANPNVTSVDAGIYLAEPNRIGDFIWNDLDKDGVQDANEPGIAGVTVMLYNATTNQLVRSTITSNNGAYAFTDVPAGTYYIKITPPPGYQVSPADNAGDDTKDSDIGLTSFATPNFVVGAGTFNLTFDAGLNVTPTTRAALGDRVWEDLDGDNVQDANEMGVAGVLVQLFFDANNDGDFADPGENVPTATLTTDAFGYYFFNNLLPGRYYVRFTTPAGYNLVTADVGDDRLDSDVNGANGAGTTAAVVLVADQVRLTIDAGIRRTTAGLTGLGDFVWYDLDKDGIQDANEAGVPGVIVILYNSSNAVVATTATDNSGFYLFTGLPVGTSYTVGFTNIPTGYVFTAQDQGGNDNTDSDVSPSTGRTASVTTTAAVNYSVDAGIALSPNVFNSKASIGDLVWNDLNNNGIQDAGEPGVGGITVTLYAADGVTVVATTVTDALGYYIFTNLDAGSYVIGFSNLPSGYVFATANAGGDDAKDSDVIGGGKTAPITVAAGEVNLTIDAGVRNTTTLPSLGDRVWIDLNSNGIQDAGEPGVAGVSVTLYNSAGNAIRSTVSDENGLYLFTDITPGTYTIGFSNLPAGYIATAQNAAGSTAANNSDANPATLRTGNITMTPTTDITWDLGIRSTTRAAIGDFVWRDTDRDGIQDAGEPGVAGITVTLYDNAGNPVATTVTDANGFYLFTNVLPGTYTVGFSNLPASSGFTLRDATADGADSDPDPNAGAAFGRTASFTVAAGQVKRDVDAGIISLLAAVGDYVWNDVNNNGIQNNTETGVPGVTVILYRPGPDGVRDGADDTPIASAVTDGNGKYFIGNIPVSNTCSQFFIRFVDRPVNSIFTVALVGGAASATNSKAAQLAAGAETGSTPLFTLCPEEINSIQDAGLVFTGGGPLPVTGIQASAVLNGTQATVKWFTLSEANTSKFVVERSTDNRTFDAVGTKTAAGSSAQRIDYNYADDIASVRQASVIYYRVAVIDADGSLSYSNVVMVRPGTVRGVKVWPVPFNSNLSIQFQSQNAGVMQVRIYDAKGSLVKTSQFSVGAGVNSLSVQELQALPAGSYSIELFMNNARVHSQQLLKQ